MDIETETPSPEPSDASSDLRSDLNAAIEAAEVESPADPSPAPEQVEATPESPPASAEKGSSRDEKGRFAPKVATPTTEKAPEAKEAAPTLPPGDPKAPGAPTPTPTVETLKPPASWKPIAREEWGKLPEVLQREVIRRERETQTALEQSAEARQGHQKFREIVAPFESAMRAEGADPYAVVQSLLRTTAALNSAPIPRKAAIIADLIKTYLPGRESLEILDGVLAGTYQEQPGHAAPQQPYRDPRVDGLLQQLEQAKQSREQTLTQQAIEETRAIEGEEFFQDVREEMADLMEVAAKRGVALSVRECYDRAVQLNPGTAKVLQQRQAARAASNPQGSTQRARAAASSVKPSPAAPPNGAQSDDLRSILENAWDRSTTR